MNEVIGNIFVFFLLGGLYGSIGGCVWILIDPLDDDLTYACIFFWPIIILVKSVKSLVRSIKKIVKYKAKGSDEG